MTLDMLRAGERAVIKNVKIGESREKKLLRCRLLDLGIVPGTEIEVTKVAPLGDPLEIRLRWYELTIRRSDAAEILLAEPGEPVPCFLRS